MLDKLFVRVRSWLHNDPTGVLGETALNTPAPSVAKPSTTSAPASSAVDQGQADKSTGTPPPLPPDAWNESESGMVITESGIIIIDPAAVEATRAAPPARPPLKGVPEEAAWALPSLPRPGATSPVPAPMSVSSTTTSNSAQADWDDVLARARAQLASPSSASPQPGARKAGARSK